MIVVVTGATGEAGRAVSSALLAAGHTVIAVGSNELRLGEVNATWRFVADLTDPKDTAELARQVHEREGGVDALIHLVGGWRGGHGPEDWDWLEPRVLTTLRLATLALMNDLTASTSARLVTIGSVAESNPTWGGANYSVLKAAASAWVSAVASGWRKGGTGAAVELVLKSIGEGGTDIEAISAKVLELMAPEAASLNGSRVDLTA